MIAVMLAVPANHGFLPVGWVAALSVICLALSIPAMTGRIGRRPVAIGVIVLALLVLAVPIGAVWCSACQNCDPWWLEYFFICWPSA